ncbi:uncharacterized protein LOC116222047 isoform X2 [Clupea harengus]|uniref:Uncharacterized protein LOC116222047 isoform X2 n=1 Tax=Clupea harengus TaxID=7950 RepID=A0A6P8G574_CLUHA|nr:uncharacterized protein LOC116222047 isoform X2 [Clupea harengus]
MDPPKDTPGNRTTNPVYKEDSLSQQNKTTSTLLTSPVTRPLSKNIGSRPDWLLYTVPGLAFVLGIVLFLFVLKTHKRRTGAYYHRDMKGCSSVKQTESDDMAPKCLTTADTQSYENVLAAIYSNQEGVCFYVREDDDYVTPVGGDDAAEKFAQTPSDSLNLPDTLTEGESYENMEGLYAHPRKRFNKSQEEDEVYFDPDAVEQQCQGGLHLPQELTDTDSYENMEQNFAAHQQDSDDMGHCSRLMSCPLEGRDYYTEDSYVSMEDNLMSPMEDPEWD